MKKFFSLLLALLMLAVMLPVTAMADENNYVTMELVYGANVSADDVTAAKAMYENTKYDTCKAANEAYMALFGVAWTDEGILNVTNTGAPLHNYRGIVGSVTEVKFYIHGTLEGFTSIQSAGNQIDCTVGGNHQIFRTSISIIGVNDAAGNKAKLTNGNIQAYVAGGYQSTFASSGKLTIDNIEFTSTTSTTVGASAARATESDTTSEVTSAMMEIKNCKFNGRLYVYDNFENMGKMTYDIHDNVFNGENYSGDSNAYSIFVQAKGANQLKIRNNQISGYARGINIDYPTVNAVIENNTISITDTGRSCIQLSRLTTAAVQGNTLNLTGGNAFTLHEGLLNCTTTPEISITGNTITGTGYLIYDDTRAFTEDTLHLTYSNNTVAGTVNTAEGVKNGETFGLSEIVEEAIEQEPTVPGTITIIVPSNEETPKPADDQKNPATGANDFVGVAAAAAVMALLGSAVVLRKK